MITLSKTRTSNHLTNEDIEELKKFIAKSSLWFRSNERVLTMHEQAALGHASLFSGGMSIGFDAAGLGEKAQPAPGSERLYFQ
jgi:hypothetical protein